MTFFRHKPTNEAQGGGWDWPAIVITLVLAVVIAALAAHHYGWLK